MATRSQGFSTTVTMAAVTYGRNKREKISSVLHLALCFRSPLRSSAISQKKRRNDLRIKRGEVLPEDDCEFLHRNNL